MKITKQSRDRFMTTFDEESDVNNFRFSFKVMSKKYGANYIDWCKDMWMAAKDTGCQTKEEFCKMNADMPIGFFNNVINK